KFSPPGSFGAMKPPRKSNGPFFPSGFSKRPRRNSPGKGSGDFPAAQTFLPTTPGCWKSRAALRPLSPPRGAPFLRRTSMLFDTHAHMDDSAFDADREALLAALPEKGIGLLMNPGCSLASSRNAVALAESY